MNCFLRWAMWPMGLLLKIQMDFLTSKNRGIFNIKILIFLISNNVIYFLFWYQLSIIGSQKFYFLISENEKYFLISKIRSFQILLSLKKNLLSEENRFLIIKKSIYYLLSIWFLKNSTLNIRKYKWKVQWEYNNAF